MRIAAALVLSFGFAAAALAEASPPATIVCPPGASAKVRLAAREVRRYVYLRTGALLPVAESAAGNMIAFQTDPALEGEQYALSSDGKSLAIRGGSDQALLYGAYAFAEKLGVRFYLHGDTIPDVQIRFALPVLDETRKPLFATRGIQPFHDFPEGPDWWNRDDYLAYLGQAAKMKMNFIGLHCYPENDALGPETGVWIGLPEDLAADGTVRFGYTAHWANTAKGVATIYSPMKTSDFTGGAAELFPTDDYGPDVMKGLMPAPATLEDRNELFNRVGRQFHDVFAAARLLGVKTCIGTATPLCVPRELREHLKKLGKNPDDPETIKDLYRGLFARIAKLYPVDYYWLWTSEGWTWCGNDPAQFKAIERDIQTALDVLHEMKDPFTLATCGWVLGPQHDRAALDKLLPKNCPMSCISRNVGHEGVEPAFARLQDRPKWAIPWVENDPNMIGYQPWVARMRYDAFDAKRFGCTGLLGIHWRTKILAQNLAALAGAGWDQSFVPPGFDTTPVKPFLPGPGGHTAVSQVPITGGDNAEVYKTVRYALDGYELAVPNGTYTVTLKFAEIAYDAPGTRIFGVKVQDKVAAEKLDLAAVAGRGKAYDLKVPGVRVHGGELKIGFTQIVEHPCISAIVIEGTTDAANQIAAAPFTRKINCGGGAVADYEADLAANPISPSPIHRAMPNADFYADFARANFGSEVADAAGALLASLDGEMKVSEWGPGPGALKTGGGYAAVCRERGPRVEEFAALRGRVVGAGNLERFDYWTNTMRASIAMSEGAAVREKFVLAVQAAKAEPAAAKKAELVHSAVKLRIGLARAWDKIMALEIAVADTPGELGTIANLETHSRKCARWLDELDGELAQLLGRPLPEECGPARAYSGAARLTVLTVRTSAAKGESLALPIIAMDKTPVKSVSLRVRPLGGGEWQTILARHVARAVWQGELPPAACDFEYHVVAETASGAALTWPASAPRISQTVILQD